MADTLTVTVDQRFPQKVGAYGKMGLLTGSTTISSYSTSKVAVTQVTGMFRSQLRVNNDSVSSNGYAIRWDSSTNAWRAYTTGAALSGVLAEATNAANIGSFSWFAVGMVATGG